jgi:hypothetical protein
VRADRPHLISPSTRNGNAINENANAGRESRRLAARGARDDEDAMTGARSLEKRCIPSIASAQTRDAVANARSLMLGRQEAPRDRLPGPRGHRLSTCRRRGRRAGACAVEEEKTTATKGTRSSARYRQGSQTDRELPSPARVLGRAATPASPSEMPSPALAPDHCRLQPRYFLYLLAYRATKIIKASSVA